MNKKSLLYLAVCIIGVLIFSAFYFFAEPISQDNTGYLYQIEQGVKSLMVILMGLFVSRFISLAILKPIEKNRGHPVPKILKDFINFIIIIIASFFILSTVYEKGSGWFATTLASAIALFAYIEKELIKDFIAGIISDFNRSVEVGDWLELPNGKIVNVIKKGTFEVETKTIEDIVIIIGNHALASSNLINFSKPTPSFWGNFFISLDQSIPVKRAYRILQAGAMNAKGVLDKQVKIFANEPVDGGITYEVKFLVENYGIFNRTRHNVIESVIKLLDFYGIQISESSGVYRIIESKETFVDEIIKPSNIIKSISLFSNCTTEEQIEVSKFFKLKTFEESEIIIQENSYGESMYFIAEGVVDVSVLVKSENEDEEPVRTHLTYLSNNSFFGENGVLYDSPRNAQISAYSNVILYELTKTDLRNIIKNIPGILEKITDIIFARSQEREKTIEDVNEEISNKNLKSEFIAAFKKFLDI